MKININDFVESEWEDGYPENGIRSNKGKMKQNNKRKKYKKDKKYDDDFDRTY